MASPKFGGKWGIWMVCGSPKGVKRGKNDEDALWGGSEGKQGSEGNLGSKTANLGTRQLQESPRGVEGLGTSGSARI